MTTTETDNSQAKSFKIQSNDNEIYTIDQAVVEQSSTIKTLAEGKYEDTWN